MSENKEGDKVPSGPQPSRDLATELREEIIRDVYRWFRKRWLAAWPVTERSLGAILVAGLILLIVALVFWRQRMEARRELAEATIEQGVDYLAQGDFDSALSSFTTVADELAPRKPDGYRYRGELYVRRGVQQLDPDLVKLAVKDLTKAIVIHGAGDREEVLAESHFWRGRAYVLQGRFDEAVVDFSRTLQILPDHVDALWWRSQAYVTQRKFIDALHDVNRAVDLDPRRVEIYGSRALIHFERLELDKALVDCNMRITLGLKRGADSPDLGDAYQRRGHILLLLRRYDEAIADYTEAIRRHPMYADLRRFRNLAKRLKEYAESTTDVAPDARSRHDMATHPEVEAAPH